jgi:hypothetical protein
MARLSFMMGPVTAFDHDNVLDDILKKFSFSIYSSVVGS